jgi:hypothetical protein
MKQFNLFGKEEIQKEERYSNKILAPIYEPKNNKPHIGELFDESKTIRIVNEITNSNLTEEERKFLIKSAQRHIVFHYERIADYYAHATPEMQQLMERSGLIIIDFNKAIEFGFIKVCDAVRKQYLEEYEK